jgi:predicted metal-dependent hydrolase
MQESHNLAATCHRVPGLSKALVWNARIFSTARGGDCHRCASAYGDAMTERFSIGDPPIEITVRHSVRARRYGLRISRTDGAVILTVPTCGKLARAKSFAEQQEAWLRRNLDKQEAPILPGFGDRIPVAGTLLRIAPGAGRLVARGGDDLLVPGQAHQLPGRLRAFYKLCAREVLVPASERYAGLLNRQIGRVTLRDTRSRWGSCTADGNLMYSWRLAMAPVAVQDYVAAHEVCHLLEMNHGPGFWRLVGRLCPDFEAHRGWLRQHGSGLHRYRL